MVQHCLLHYGSLHCTPSSFSLQPSTFPRMNCLVLQCCIPWLKHTHMEQERSFCEEVSLELLRSIRRRFDRELSPPAINFSEILQT